MTANAISNDTKTQVANGIEFTKAVNSECFPEAADRIANYTLSDSPQKYTYVPAVMHSAITYLAKHPELENKLKAKFAEQKIPYSRIAGATSYTFSVFSDTLQSHHADAVDVVSLRDIAFIPNMEKKEYMELWLKHGCHHLGAVSPNAMFLQTGMQR